MSKALLGGLSAILVVAVVVGVVATVTRSGKKAGDNFTVPGEASLATSGKSVKSLCAPTLYKESCEKTLSQANNGTENPKDVFHSVAKVALESVKSAVEQSKAIGEAKSSKDPMTEGAREDCKNLLEDAVDDLLAGEVRVVGGHGPREPPRQGMRVGRRGGEGERRGGGEADAAEDRRTERRRRHFLSLCGFGFDSARPGWRSRSGRRAVPPCKSRVVWALRVWCDFTDLGFGLV